MNLFYKKNIYIAVKCGVCALLAFALCFSVFVFSKGEKAKAYVYMDGFTTVGDVTMPFTEYMPGSYFTKNGGPCYCHDNASIDCISSGSGCNCLRIPTIDGERVDLRAVQCIGFARYCFYRLFGVVDHQYNSSAYIDVGSIAAGQVTASSVKNLIAKLKPGAHIRFQLSASQHSVIVLNTSETGLTVYHANAGGNGITGDACIVSTRTFTWQEFATWTFRGIVFAHMPLEYPEHLSFSDMPVIEDMETGYYETTSNLNLREGASASTSSLGTVSKGTTLAVTETSGIWGKVIYDGKEGWICLQYAKLVEKEFTEPLLPAEGSGLSVKSGYIFGVACGNTVSELEEMFVNEDISFENDIDGLVATGTVLKLTVNEEEQYSYFLVVAGDINCDGDVTAADCVELKSHLTGAELLAEAPFAASDVDGNGRISTADYKKLQLALK